MGKPILLTPLSNKLPEDLIHGKHIHIATTENELIDGITLLLTNNEYCSSLSENIKTYYDNYANPATEIKRKIKQ